jgi:hypothetical protein
VRGDVGWWIVDCVRERSEARWTVLYWSARMRWLTLKDEAVDEVCFCCMRSSEYGGSGEMEE